jgi:altronate dehydratase small subunit
MFHALQLEPGDNVATLVVDAEGNTELTIQAPGKTVVLTTVDSIPFGHKVALTSLNKGDIVSKYGRPIGRTMSDIPKGGLVGVHNLEGLRGRGDLVQERGASK